METATITETKGLRRVVFGLEGPGQGQLVLEVPATGRDASGEWVMPRAEEWAQARKSRPVLLGVYTPDAAGKWPVEAYG